MRKALQYIKAVILIAPVVIYYALRYMIRYSRHPEKYPLEKRYAVARNEIRYALKLFHVDFNLKNFNLTCMLFFLCWCMLPRIVFYCSLD